MADDASDVIGAQSPDTTTNTSSQTGQGQDASSSAGSDGPAPSQASGDSGSSNGSSDSSTGDGTSVQAGPSDSSSSSGSGAADASASGSSGSAGSSDGAESSDSSGSPGSSADGAPSDHTPVDQLALDTIQPVTLAATAAAPSSTEAASLEGAGAVAASEGSGLAGGVSVSDIIAIGTTVAKIMEASSPDYTMRDNPVSVIPKAADPLVLTGVKSPPNELRIPINYRNGLHMLVCNLPVVVQWRFGGSYNGAGLFITTASAFLDSGSDTGIGYKADVSATMNGPRNAGTDPNNPIAAIDVHIEVKVVDKYGPGNVFLVLEGYIQGDGAGELRQRPG